MTRSFADIAGRQLRTTTGKVDSRRKLVMAVRAAARRLQMQDDDRRAIQLELTGKASMADMTIGEIGQVLDRLNRDRPAPAAQRAHTGKIRALWWSLYWLGQIDAPNDAALDAFVKRQTGMSSIRFVDHRKAPALIEAMKAMAARAGVRWLTDKEAEARGLEQPQADRLAVLDAIWGMLCDRQLGRRSGMDAYLGTALKVEGAAWTWTAHELDAAIRLLGKRLRRILDKRTVE